MKKILALYIFSILLVGCARQDDVMEYNESSGRIAAVSASALELFDNSGENSDPADEPVIDDDGNDAEVSYVIQPLMDTQFKDNSILYISQIGTKVNPNFPEGYNAETSDSDSDFATKYPEFAEADIFSKNLYPYIRNDVDDANWEEGFNFQPKEETEPLEWGHIRRRGPVGNSYNLIALYYPFDNTTRFGVEPDQSSLDNLLKSDVLGAFHSTSTLFSRLRFRLFHLMTYIRVTLYVPVYNTEDNSGFLADAYSGAWVLDVLNDFRIEYRAGITSDTRGPVITAIADNDENKGVDVRMYCPNSTSPEKTSVKVSDYYDDGTNQKDRTDEVYAYTFHALIPFPDTRYNSTETQKVDFLKFSFATPGGNIKNYYFNDTQRYISDDHAGSVLSLKQGAIQDLFLYLPRGGNGTIYVKANVSDWNNSSSDIPMFDGKSPDSSNN